MTQFNLNPPESDKIDNETLQNLIQHDEATTNEYDIDGIRTNNNLEFKAREGENFEEEELNNEVPIISTNTETTNSDPDLTRNNRSGKAI